VRADAGKAGSLLELNGVPVGARLGDAAGPTVVPEIARACESPGSEMVVRGRVDVSAEIARDASARLRADVSLGGLSWTAAEIEEAVKRAGQPIRMAGRPAGAKSREAGHAAGPRSKEAEAQETRLMRLVAEGWRDAGFEVAELMRALDSSSPRARELFSQHEAAVSKLREMDSRLAALSSGSRAPEVAMIRSMLKDPAKVAELEAEVSRLMTRIEEERKLERLRRQEDAGARQAAELRRRERIRRVREVYQAVLHAPLKGGSAPGRKGSRALDRTAFDTFLITARNREAYDACLAAARRSRKHLLVLVTGPRSTGKSHLLRALVAQATATGRVAASRIDCADPLAGLPAVEADLGLRALRRARNSDAIIALDHLDHVCARDDLAAEVANIVDDAMARGAHVVGACQQSAPTLAALPQRTADHLRTGMVVEAIPPGFDDRVEILGRRASALGYDLPKGTLAFIARAHSADIGIELASLEKMLAFSALLRRAPDLEFARSTVADSMMI
jgi:chromosomal replication initiation ATPase DnaA